MVDPVGWEHDLTLRPALSSTPGFSVGRGTAGPEATEATEATEPLASGYPLSS